METVVTDLPCPHALVAWKSPTESAKYRGSGYGGWFCERCGVPFVVGDPREVREAVAAEISMTRHVDDIAGQMRTRLEQWISMDLFSTQKDDHTRSLSERVTYLEEQLGTLRESWRQHEAYMDWERSMSTWQLIRRRLLAVRWHWPIYSHYRD